MHTHFTGLWRQPDFMKLWMGQTISEIGSRISREGLPLTAVLVLGATPAQMGLLSAIGAAPVLLVGLVAGAWIDRLRRRPILVAADLGRAVLLLSIPIAALSGQLTIAQLLIVTALVGVLTVFFYVAYESFLPSLVERENIVEGNSKLALSGSTAEVLGPSLAGVLVQALTAPIAILIDALSFLASALFVGLIRKPEPFPPPSEGQRHLGREILEGLRMVMGNPLLRALAGSMGTVSFFGNFVGSLYILFAIRDLKLGPAALGLTITVGGIGSLIGALLAEPVVKRFGLGPTFIGTIFVRQITGLLIPLAGGPLFVAISFLMAGQLFGDSASTIYFINELSLRQAITPDRLLGRTNASMNLIVAGVGPLGAVVGGVLGGLIGLRLTLAIAALGGLLGILWLLCSPVRTLREQPAPAWK